MSKNPVPENVRDSWARLRTGARVAVEQTARAVRLLVRPAQRNTSDSPPPPNSERRFVGPTTGKAGAGNHAAVTPFVTPPSSSTGPVSTREGAGREPIRRDSPGREGAPPSSRSRLSAEAERAAYRRVQTPAFFRPAGLKPFLHLQNGQGGEARLRMYSDALHACGDHLKLELIFPNGEDRSFTVEIAWVDELPRESPARYDVGLLVLDLDPATRQLLASVLAAQEP